MMNSVNLTGRLTKDVELRYSPSGVAVCNFTLAVNRSFTDQNGERQADFPQVVAFNKTAENIGNFLNKGSLVAVEGRLQTRSYENNDGQMIYVTEVVADRVHFLESKKEETTGSKQNKGNNNRQSYNSRGKR